MASNPMYAIRTISGNQPHIRGVIEDAAQTFLIGTPLMLNTANGAVAAWNGTAYTKIIIGVAKTNAQDLALAGVAVPLHYGSVINQPAALNIPVGQPLAYPRVIFETSTDDSVFYGQVGPAQSAAQTNVGVAYGMAKDSDGHWYVDLTNTTNPVVNIVGLDQYDTPRGVHFQFLASAANILG